MYKLKDKINVNFYAQKVLDLGVVGEMPDGIELAGNLRKKGGLDSWTHGLRAGTPLVRRLGWLCQRGGRKR